MTESSATCLRAGGGALSRPKPAIGDHGGNAAARRIASADLSVAAELQRVLLAGAVSRNLHPITT